jgi:pseudouridine-5'-phosphate glycosidase
MGRDRTPDLLKAVAQRTGGRALDANLALLAENAVLAARIAVELAAG